MITCVRNTIGALAAMFFVIITSACSGSGTMPQTAPPQMHRARSLAAVPGPRYQLVMLPSGLVPEAISDGGTVVGFDFNTSHGFAYAQGRTTELPVLSGDSSGDANAINNRGQIVGYSIGDTDVVPCFTTICEIQHPVLYEDGKIAYLGALTDPNGFPSIIGDANGINDSGEIVGVSGFPTDLAKFAELAIFRPGPVHGITFDGFLVYGSARLNNAGEMAGVAETIWAGSPEGAFAYPNPIVCSPPLIVPGGAFFDINDAGDTISLSEGNPTYCTHGAAITLPLYPSALNNRGDIIGFATEPQTMLLMHGKLRNVQPGLRYGNYYVSRDRAGKGIFVSIGYGDAVLYSNGTLYDLNDLAPKHPGIVLQNPVAINNRGDIVGSIVPPGSSTFEGYLLTRIP
jgi:hypothetical protein